MRADRRSRTPRVIPPRGDRRLPPGVWGSDQASMTIKEGGAGATVEILASGCFGSYGDISQEIPNGRFSLSGTYTQLMGAFPGKVEHPAQFSGSVEGTRMTLTITVPDVSLVVGPFVLTSGVTNAWEPCRYP
jgi:hypothetical protein